MTDDPKIGAGIAGWATCNSLMMFLHMRGVLSQVDGVAVFENALIGLDVLAQSGPHRDLITARELLQEQLVAWHEQTQSPP
jgi:hypothetical protein